MRQPAIFVWAAVCLMLSCKTGTDAPKDTPADATASSEAVADPTGSRYSLASAKVTTVMQLPGGIGQNTSILYFTGHGEKEMRENITEVSMGSRQMRPPRIK